MVTFRKKYFNHLYFILNEIIKDKSIRTVLVYGGKSSSKTVSIVQLMSKEALVKGSSTIAFRKESAIIKTTLKKSFNLALDTMFIAPAFTKYDLSYKCSNGAEIIMKGLDSEEKAKGIESYKYVYLDELNHFEYLEYEQFELSLRGIEGQKIFASWNPVDENSWVKTELVDKNTFTNTDKFGTLPCPDSFIQISDDGGTILIRTTYLDNYWIVGSPCGTYGYRDENLIAKYEALRTKNYNSYKVNVLGDWGKTTFGGEFLKQWRSEKHTGLHPYNPKLAVHLIFDENVNPYFPCGFFQVEDDNKSARMVHAIALRNPDNTTKAMGREIIRKLRSWGHEEAVYIGGDATSQKDDVKQEKGHDLFRLMMNELVDFKPRRAVLKSNPSVRVSADFLNEILENEYLGINYSVDKSCRLVIADYENTKEDKNGKVDKKTVTDPATKVSYQPYGHFVDITRYFFVQTFYNEYIQYQKGGIESPIKLGRNYSKNNY